MTRFQINIFYAVSFICSLLLISYIWLVFLPIFEDTSEYEFIRNVSFIITVLLLVSAGIQLFLSIIKERPQRTKSIRTD